MIVCSPLNAYMYARLCWHDSDEMPNPIKLKLSYRMSSLGWVASNVDRLEPRKELVWSKILRKF